MTSSSDARGPRGFGDPARDGAHLSPDTSSPEHLRTEQPLTGARADDVEADEIAADGARRGSLRRAWHAQSRGRRIFVLVGALLSLIGTVVVVWFALSATVTKPMWRDVSFDVVDDRLTTMRFELTKPRDMTVECTVIAQETNHGVVGRTVVTVGPTQTASTVHEVRIRTTGLAVIGTVRTCAERSG